MDKPVASTAPTASSWAWLCIVVGGSIVIEISAVRTGDLGGAISGVGIALLGAFAFLYAPSFRANMREVLRPPRVVDPKIAYLAAVGMLLNFIGLGVRWLG